MAKRTKAELLRIRSETYRPPDPNGERCENCKHAWQRSFDQSFRCDVIEIRGEVQSMGVHGLGRCDLFEPKEPRP